MSNYSNDVDEIFSEHENLLLDVRERCQEKIIDISKKIAENIKLGSTLFFCGNGGSAADSQHLAAEFVGRFKKDRKPLRSIALTTDTSIITCVSNDYSYDQIFSRQLEGLADKNDLLITFSTSGDSKNIINALEMGNKLEMLTIAFLGKSGGLAKEIAQNVILIPSYTTARIQEMHILLGHILCEIVEKELNLN